MNIERPKQITFSACYKFKNSTTTMFVRVDDVSAAFWCDSLYELVGSDTLSCLESGGFKSDPPFLGLCNIILMSYIYTLYRVFKNMSHSDGHKLCF